jgi:hypothetical protein
MSAQAPHLSADEVGDRGERIYETALREKVEPGNTGKFIAIDIHSGEYEIGPDHRETVNRLHERVSDAEVYTIKIGYPATAVTGGRLRPNPPRTVA